jgi:hypothetical protein
VRREAPSGSSCSCEDGRRDSPAGESQRLSRLGVPELQRLHRRHNPTTSIVAAPARVRRLLWSGCGTSRRKGSTVVPTLGVARGAVDRDLREHRDRRMLEALFKNLTRGEALGCPRGQVPDRFATRCAGSARLGYRAPAARRPATPHQRREEAQKDSPYQVAEAAEVGSVAGADPGRISSRQSALCRMLERQRPAAASGRAGFSRLDERDHRTAHTDLAGATPEIGQGDYVAARTNSRARAFSRNAMNS